jgi:hypothetical protein
LIRFVAVILAVALCVVALLLLSSSFGWIAILPSYYIQSALLLTIFTIVIYRYLDRVNKPAMFVQLYLLSMAIKLLGYGAYVTLMIVDDKAGANRNVLFFLVLYVVFTALEVGFLHRKIAGNRPR